MTQEEIIRKFLIAFNMAVGIEERTVVVFGDRGALLQTVKGYMLAYGTFINVPTGDEELDRMIGLVKESFVSCTELLDHAATIPEWVELCDKVVLGIRASKN